ncbi:MULTISPECIES: hypothetical protein [unclassified Streptomyces]|uniref:hypothetical protein n=1 Tax=unclassified Streptomyces TaxID=2593676 RepID=UPI003823D2E2
MELFIEEVEDIALADRLRIAIGGRGAFRRFKRLSQPGPPPWDVCVSRTETRPTWS